MLMPARPYAALACAAALLLASGSAPANNLNFLGQAPIARYDETDMDLLRGALGKALTSDTMDVAFEFANPKTGASGTITPLRTFTQNGLPCRDLRGVLRHPRTATADAIYTLCKREGRWKLAAPPRQPR
jgi:hypothetical protein